MFLRVVLLLLLSLSLSGCVFSFFEDNSTFPEGTTDDDYPSYDRYNAATPAIKELPSQITLEAIHLLEDIFQSPKVGEIKCTDVRIFQKFVERYFIDENGSVPKLNFLCLVKYDFTEDELSWVLSAPREEAWHLLPPTSLIDSDLSIIKNIEVNLESSIRIHQETGLTRLILNGVRFNLSKKAIAGTSYSWLPESLLRFRVEYIEFKDNGAYSIHLRFPLGIPFKILGALEPALVKQSVLLLGYNLQFTF